jgi:hypothetical protein
MESPLGELEEFIETLDLTPQEEERFERICNRPLRMKKPGATESKWEIAGQNQG